LQVVRSPPEETVQELAVVGCPLLVS